MFLTTIASVCSGMIVHPIDTIKIRMQIQGEGMAAGVGVQHKTFLHCGINIVRAERIRGLYRGISASFGRECSFSTMRLGLYEPYKNLVGAKEENAPLYLQAVAGFCSGFTGGIFTNPVDLMKVRMQTDTGPL